MVIFRNLLITALLLFFCYSCVDLISGAECNPDKGQTCSEVPPTPVTNTTTKALNTTESVPENGWAKNIHVVNAKARAFEWDIGTYRICGRQEWIH